MEIVSPLDWVVSSPSPKLLAKVAQMGGYGLNPTGSCGRGIIGRAPLSEPVGLPNGLIMVALGATSELGTAPEVVGSPVGFGGNVAWIEGVVGGAVTPV